jgi:hypothetical protein
MVFRASVEEKSGFYGGAFGKFSLGGLLSGVRALTQRVRKLYRKRWGVETFIFVIKSFFQLFNFSTIKENGIWQDVFATFTLYNLQTVLNQAYSRKIKASQPC